MDIERDAQKAVEEVLKTVRSCGGAPGIHKKAGVRISMEYVRDSDSSSMLTYAIKSKLRKEGINVDSSHVSKWGIGKEEGEPTYFWENAGSAQCWVEIQFRT